MEKKELENKISELTALKNELKNEEQAIKLTMNSIYGAIGNNFFVCFNPDVAEAVTLQGQDLIKYSEKIIHRYFHEFWHKDEELHEKLGLTEVKRVAKPLVIYGDTDSAESSTILIIKNQNCIEKISFEDFFKSQSRIYDINTDERGNEFIMPESVDSLNYIGDVIFSPIKKIIRHKVSKPKWKIISDSGKEIIVTNDHSITVFRGGKKIHVKPSEMNLETDEILTVNEIFYKEINYKYQFEKIKSCECIGEFEDEYVYDLEIDEEGYDNQTFFANDMLVHNSNYVSFQEVVDSCNWEGDPKDLILMINEHRLKDYLKNCFDVYSKKWGTENYQDFEMETLARNGIFLGKKKYVNNLIYSDGVHMDSLSSLKFTGVEMIKGGTPSFVREKLVYLTKYIFSKGKDFSLREFTLELKSIKREFKAQQAENISLAVQINNYEKFILNDTSAFEVAKGCPIHVRASGYHNYILNSSKYKDKYPLLRSGEKIRFYFVATKTPFENNVFGFSPGVFPHEFAPPIDYDEQFTKTILDPINRFIEVMGHNPISPNLFSINPLF
jgi:hypothetical protein